MQNTRKQKWEEKTSPKQHPLRENMDVAKKETLRKKLNLI